MSAVMVAPVSLVNPVWVVFSLVVLMVVYFNETQFSRKRLLVGAVAVLVAAVVMQQGPSIVIQDPCASVEPQTWIWYLLGCGL